jgi:hypothetical protein
MSRTTFIAAEVGSAVAAIAGFFLLLAANFDGAEALWGVLLLAAGLAAFLAVRYVRRESGIRYKR